MASDVFRTRRHRAAARHWRMTSTMCVVAAITAFSVLASLHLSVNYSWRPTSMQLNLATEPLLALSLKDNWIKAVKQRNLTMPPRVRTQVERRLVTKEHHPPRLLLLPVLPFGPNNQYEAFRQSLVLAKWLNRTLVAPPFFRHRTEQDPKVPINPEDVYDLEDIEKFQPIIHFKKWRSLCSSVEAVFQFRDFSRRHSQDIVSGYIGRTFRRMGLDVSYSALFPLMRPKPYHAVKTPPEARKTFASTKRCAVVLFFPFPMPLVDIRESSVELAKHLHRSLRIQRLAAYFAARRMQGAKHAVMHWRYNDEWSNRWCEQTLNGVLSKARVGHKTFKACKAVITMNATLFMKNLQQYLSSRNVTYIYVATPLNASAPFLVSLLKKVSGVLTMADLWDTAGPDSAVSKDTGGMKPMAHNMDVSLVEQELASTSSLFIASEISSWSTNVMFERQGPPGRMWSDKKPVISANSLMTTTT